MRKIAGVHIETPTSRECNPGYLDIVSVSSFCRCHSTLCVSDQTFLAYASTPADWGSSVNIKFSFLVLIKPIDVYTIAANASHDSCGCVKLHSWRLDIH